MKKTVLIILGLLSIVFLAILVVRGITGEDTWICQDGEWVKHGNPSAPQPTGTCKQWSLFGGKKEEIKVASLPNPASQDCVDKGGNLKTVKETAGELGICQFSDGSQCEEWKLFRNECQKGQTNTADISHPYSGLIRKTGGKYSFDAGGVVYSLELPASANSDLKKRLESEVGGKEAVTIIAAETPPLSQTLILKGFQDK